LKTLVVCKRAFQTNGLARGGVLDRSRSPDHPGKEAGKSVDFAPDFLYKPGRTGVYPMN